MRKNLYMLAVCGFGLLGCKKEINSSSSTVVDNYIYELNEQQVYQSSAEKDKQKSSNQLIAILYSNLFRSAIPPQAVVDLSQIRLAIGDKQIADELILNGFISEPSVQIPTNAQMRADVEQFINDTYRRFYLRQPNAYELLKMKQLIEEDPTIEPSHIYQGFALSNEYKYY